MAIAKEQLRQIIADNDINSVWGHLRSLQLSLERTKDLKGFFNSFNYTL